MSFRRKKIGIFVGIALGLVLAQLCLSCAGSGWSSRVDWKEVDWSRLPEQKDYPDDGAVIVLDDGKMEVTGDRDLALSRFDRHRIVKVFSALGHRFAYVVIPYAEGSSVESIEGRTIAPSGKISVLSEKNIFDVSLYPNFVFFSDQRAKIFTLPAVEDGATLEYHYSIAYRGRTYSDSWVFQNDAPTVCSRFTVVKPSEWDLRYRVRNITIEPRITRAPNTFPSTHVWEARNIPKSVTEVATPPGREKLGHISFSPIGFTSWQDVSSWYHRLSEERIRGGQRVKDLALRLTEGVVGEREKLRRIFDWVRDQIRYVAVEIGIGGYQPHPAEDVCVNRYGDCKDMTVLLCALAKEAGIDVQQVLISSWYNGKPDTLLPSPMQFNHAIAYAPVNGGGPQWMDPTEKGSPFGALPWYDQGMHALAVAKDGRGEIVTTPLDSMGSNSQEDNWKVTLGDSGQAIVTVHTILRGSPATELRGQLLSTPKETHRRWLEEMLAERISGIQVDSFRVDGVKPVGDSLLLWYSFSTQTFGSRRGDLLAVRPFMVAASSLPDEFRSPTRASAVRFRFAMTESLHLLILHPAGWRAVTPFFADSLDSPFGGGAWKFQGGESVSEISSQYGLRAEDVQPGQYPQFRAFLDALRKKDLREVLLWAIPGAGN